MRSSREFTLTQLSYFARAAELGSMTDAAVDLFIAQSAVSNAITQLEKTFDTQLFIRHRTKGLQLTATGTELLTRTRAILGAVDDTYDAFRPDALDGTLHAACFPSLAPFFLPQIMLDLAQQHPGIEPHIRDYAADEIVRSLSSRAIDIALTYDLGLGDGIRKERLATAPLYVALAEDDPLALRGRLSLAELATEPMVLLDMPISRDYFTDVFTSRGLTPTIRYRFASFEAVRAMVARGHGYSLLHQRPAVGRTYDGGRITAVPLTDDVPGLDIVLASREGEPLNRKAAVFAEHCRAALSAAVAGARP
ncbi:LysR family transcriptional regulator [Microbacterium sp. 18062]|uniref:LysR family transcriptional regulator n=1 Tax=Microbacterium sp. 18062 TaxID=2681410 RepID=UPI00135C5766|nr:LysR family transcriptional regulator [Microbacterium sp. 18062]